MKKILTLLLSLWTVIAIAQNDPLYNQYLFNQSMINPAYNGINNVFNATAISRVQWAGVDGAPLTNTLSVSSSFLKDKLGAGALFISDRLGVNSTTEAAFALNYKINFLHSKLSFGMQGGIVSYRYDYSKLNTEVVDQKVVQAITNYSKPTIGAGIYYRADNYYLGLSVPRLFNVNVHDGVSTSTRYLRHYYLSGGYVFECFYGLKFKPSFLLRFIDQKNPTVDLNMQVLMANVLWAGIVIRNFNTTGLIAQMEISNKLRAGYYFEIPVGKRALSAYGTHEIMLSIDLGLFERQVAGRRYF